MLIKTVSMASFGFLKHTWFPLHLIVLNSRKLSKTSKASKKRTLAGVFLGVLAKTQFVQNAKTQFENTKTQFENAKTQFEN